MYETFLAICLSTTLNCADIHVYKHSLEHEIYGLAGIGVSGDYHIQIATRLPRHVDVTELMIHEVAHLLAYEQDNTNNTHNREYKTICKELALTLDRASRNVCDPTV